MFRKALATLCYGVIAIGPAVAAQLQTAGQPQLAAGIGAITTIAGVVLHFFNSPLAPATK